MEGRRTGRRTQDAWRMTQGTGDKETFCYLYTYNLEGWQKLMPNRRKKTKNLGKYVTETINHGLTSNSFVLNSTFD